MNASRTAKTVVQLAFLSILVPAIVASAQNLATPASATTTNLQVGDKKYDAEKELARMAKRYNLTGEEQAKIQPILLEQQRQVHELGEDESLSNAAWASAVNKVHAQTVAQIKRQLTDIQISKYAKDEAKRAKADGGDADDGPPDGPPPDGGPPGGGPGGGGPPPGGGGPPGE